MEPVVLVHGGAGDISDQRVYNKRAGVQKAAQIGYKVLTDGGSALDAVEAAVRYLENDEAFNAGEFILYDSQITFLRIQFNINQYCLKCLVGHPIQGMSEKDLLK